MSTKAMDPEAAARIVARLARMSVADGRKIISNSRASSQSDLAAIIIYVKPSISSEALTEALHEAFPGANIGPRHGPHYLSLSRTGKLRTPAPV